jgi:hypothetical protein
LLPHLERISRHLLRLGPIAEVPAPKLNIALKVFEPAEHCFGLGLPIDDFGFKGGSAFLNLVILVL